MKKSEFIELQGSLGEICKEAFSKVKDVALSVKFIEKRNFLSLYELTKACITNEEAKLDPNKRRLDHLHSILAWCIEYLKLIGEDPINSELIEEEDYSEYCEEY